MTEAPKIRTIAGGDSNVATVTKTRWCSRCRAATPHSEHSHGVGKHLILSFVTLGLWPIYWWVLPRRIGVPRCVSCGHRQWPTRIAIAAIVGAFVMAFLAVVYLLRIN